MVGTKPVSRTGRQSHKVKEINKQIASFFAMTKQRRSEPIEVNIEKETVLIIFAS